MQEKLKEIKQSFRLYMNGVTAQSLRDKGVNYHLNWGVSLQHLQEMAAEIKADLTDAPSGELLTPPLGEAGRGSLFTLSSLLWKENIRECKILATMLMPADTFPADLAMLWVEQTPTQEIAELAAMNLYQHLPYAKDMALQLIAQPYEMAQLQGYQRWYSTIANSMNSLTKPTAPLSHPSALRHHPSLYVTPSLTPSRNYPNTPHI